MKTNEIIPTTPQEKLQRRLKLKKKLKKESSINSGPINHYFFTMPQTQPVREKDIVVVF